MVDRQKLERLRAKYGDTADAGIFDPHFRAVADTLFKSAGKRPPPYAGVPSLLRAPYRPDLAAAKNGEIDFALLGVPMDLGVTNRSGARFGPRAVRNVERIGPYEHVLRMAPLAEFAVADIGDVPLSSRYDLALCHKDIEAFVARLVEAEVIPLSVGGDHSIDLPLLRAIGKDATGRAHPYRRALRHRRRARRLQVPSRRAVPPGGARRRARSRAHDPDRHSRRRRIPLGVLLRFRHDRHPRRGGDRDGAAAVVRRIREVVGTGPTYVTFDVDSLDPAFAPGTGTPEVGGFSSADALAILEAAWAST